MTACLPQPPACPAPGRWPVTPPHLSARACREPLAAVQASYPGWRAWRTRDGDLAARKGGCPPPGPHARGMSLAELMRAIERAIDTGPPPALRPAEHAALGALAAAPGPLPVRGVSDAAGLHLSTTATVLAGLLDRGLAVRHRDGRSWLYTCASAGGQPASS